LPVSAFVFGVADARALANALTNTRTSAHPCTHRS
jgi:hypothetical protein